MRPPGENIVAAGLYDFTKGLKTSPPGWEEGERAYSHCVERFTQPEQIGFSSLHQKSQLNLIERHRLMFRHLQFRRLHSIQPPLALVWVRLICGIMNRGFSPALY